MSTTTEVSVSEVLQKGIILTVLFSGVNLIVRSVKKDLAPPPTVKNLVGVAITLTTSIGGIDYAISKGWIPKFSGLI